MLRKAFELNSLRGIWTAVSFLGIAAWYAFLTANPVNLTTADLGRHITNGKLALSQPGVLASNFYSYTFPGFPFVNHHWGSGLVFYWVHEIFGFPGLSLFYLALSIATIYFMFRETLEESDPFPAIAATFCAIPLLAYRSEIRPEAFSMFFLALFYRILARSRRGQGQRGLFLLPPLMLLWVNLHIYFVFGFFLMGVFLLDSLATQYMRGQKLRDMASTRLVKILLLCALASLVNPIGYKLALQPFQIFQNYGYRILENQSILFLWNLGMIHSILAITGIVFFLASLGALLYAWLKDEKAFSLSLGIALVFCVMASLGVRNISLAGLFLIPVLARSFDGLGSLHRGGERLLRFAPGLLGLCAILLNTWYFTEYAFGRPRGLGLAAGVNASARFFLDQEIRGPIFNNYDIGGYLIYHLFPGERVFVDNRPEAYPASFF